MSPFLLQNMEMVPVPTKSYGNFYEGDCYVLLSVGQSGVTRGAGNGLCPERGGAGWGVCGQRGLGIHGLF